MTKKPQTSKDAADKVVKNIRRKTRQTYSAEEKIRIVLAGLRGEESISVLCRREGIAESLYYSWSKEFLEAGKRWLSGDTVRHATSPEVKDLRSESLALKECVADLTLGNRLLKKSMRDLSRFDAAPLIAFTATKEIDYGTETDGRIPQRCGAYCTDQRADTQAGG